MARRRLRHVVEYALFRTMTGIVALMPARLALALGRLAGRVYYHVGPRRRRRALDNIRMALQVDPRQARAIVKKSYAALGESTAENVIFWRRLTRESLPRYV